LGLTRTAKIQWRGTQSNNSSCFRVSNNLATLTFLNRSAKIYRQNRPREDQLLCAYHILWMQLKNIKQTELQETLSCFPAKLVPALCEAVSRQVHVKLPSSRHILPGKMCFMSLPVDGIGCIHTNLIRAEHTFPCFGLCTG
jgi:hypothetical protein